MQLFTVPLDVAKVRLQLQKRASSADGAGQSKYRGLMGTIGTIAREEGLPALWKGVIAGLHRQCIYGGLRIGLYDPVSAVILQIDGYKVAILCSLYGTLTMNYALDRLNYI